MGGKKSLRRVVVLLAFIFFLSNVNLLTFWGSTFRSELGSLCTSSFGIYCAMRTFLEISLNTSIVCHKYWPLFSIWNNAYSNKTLTNQRLILILTPIKIPFLGEVGSIICNIHVVFIGAFWTHRLETRSKDLDVSKVRKFCHSLRRSHMLTPHRVFAFSSKSLMNFWNRIVYFEISFHFQKGASRQFTTALVKNEFLVSVLVSIALLRKNYFQKCKKWRTNIEKIQSPRIKSN